MFVPARLVHVFVHVSLHAMQVGGHVGEGWDLHQLSVTPVAGSLFSMAWAGISGEPAWDPLHCTPCSNWADYYQKQATFLLGTLDAFSSLQVRCR